MRILEQNVKTFFFSKCQNISNKKLAKMIQRLLNFMMNSLQLQCKVYNENKNYYYYYHYYYCYPYEI